MSARTATTRPGDAPTSRAITLVSVGRETTSPGIAASASRTNRAVSCSWNATSGRWWRCRRQAMTCCVMSRASSSNTARSSVGESVVMSVPSCNVCERRLGRRRSGRVCRIVFPDLSLCHGLLPDSHASRSVSRPYGSLCQLTIPWRRPWSSNLLRCLLPQRSQPPLKRQQRLSWQVSDSSGGPIYRRSEIAETSCRDRSRRQRVDGKMRPKR